MRFSFTVSFDCRFERPGKTRYAAAPRRVRIARADDASRDHCGEPRGLQKQHCTDLAGAQLRYESLETRTRYATAGTSPEIVINDLDVAKSVCSSYVAQRVSPALALKVVLDLRRHRLPHVDDGLASQHGLGQLLRATHRRPPSRRSPLRDTAVKAERRPFYFARDSVLPGPLNKASSSADAGGCSLDRFEVRRWSSRRKRPDRAPRPAPRSRHHTVSRNARARPRREIRNGMDELTVHTAHANDSAPWRPRRYGQNDHELVVWQNLSITSHSRRRRVPGADAKRDDHGAAVEGAGICLPSSGLQRVATIRRGEDEAAAGPAADRAYSGLIASHLASPMRRCERTCDAGRHDGSWRET